MIPDFYPVRNNILHVEDVALPQIAEQFGTPCYVYSKKALESGLREFQQLLAAHPAGKNALICYAIKANSNLAILNLFARMGAGFDIVSVGELERVLAAGANADKVVFSGVGKHAAEIARALEVGIHCFNIESTAELERVNQVAASLGKRAPISLRVNPDVDAKTHPYISTGLKDNKFGIAWSQARTVYRHAATLPNIEIIGIDCHIGSQLLDPSPVFAALDKLIELIGQLAADGIHFRHIDLGGGLGICYRAEEEAPSLDSYLTPILDRLATSGLGLDLILEPGRRLVGNAGLLLTRVEYLKPGEDKNFAIVDAAMNDLMRPALYEAWHTIQPVRLHGPNTPEHSYEIVGPICESGDFLGSGRHLALESGDLLAVMSAGAYGMAMSSNYNTRPRAAEVIVDGDRVYLVRKRETIAELFANEKTLA